MDWAKKWAGPAMGPICDLQNLDFGPLKMKVASLDELEEEQG